MPLRQYFPDTYFLFFSGEERQVFPGACSKSFPLSRPSRLPKSIHSWRTFQEHTSQGNPNKPQLRCGDANIQGRTDSKYALWRWNWNTCTAPVWRCLCLTKVANAITRPTAGTEGGSRSSSGRRSRKNFFSNWSPLVPQQSFFWGKWLFSDYNPNGIWLKSKGNTTESESNPNSICQKVKVISAGTTTNSLFRELEAKGLADVYGRYPTVGQINTKKFYMLKQSQVKPSETQL